MPKCEILKADSVHDYRGRGSPVTSVSLETQMNTALQKGGILVGSIVVAEVGGRKTYFQTIVYPDEK